MACSATATIESACEGGIGKVVDEITLLQLTAQLQADLVALASPGTDVTVAAVLSRACESGIGKVQDPIVLLQILAETACELAG